MSRLGLQAVRNLDTVGFANRNRPERRHQMAASSPTFQANPIEVLRDDQGRARYTVSRQGKRYILRRVVGAHNTSKVGSYSSRQIAVSVARRYCPALEQA